MIDVTQTVADRLAQRCAAVLPFVGTLGDFAALDKVPRQMPAAYVVPAQVDAGPNEVLGAVQQQHSLSLSVVLVLRSAGDASGSRATLALEPLRQAVQAALVGWTPEGCHAPVVYAGGRLADLMDGGTVAWQEDFTAERRVSSALQT